MSRILFYQAHDEALHKENEAFSSFFEFLGVFYNCVACKSSLTRENLQAQEARVVVLGAPYSDFEPGESDALKNFVEQGGGLLLISNADIAYSPPDGFNQLLEKSGVRIQEYLNYPPDSLGVFHPHFITANLHRISVGKLAHLTLIGEHAKPLAFTRATRRPIIACSRVGQGRVVVIGDSSLFTTDLFESGDDNPSLASNVFSWLAGTHPLDIETVKVQEAFDWGHEGLVELTLKNPASTPLPYLKCILESDNGADIAHSAKEIHDAPADKAIIRRWRVSPTALGDQGLRLSVHIEGHDEALRFDPLLPAMRCLAPGALNIAVKNAEQKPQTQFRTGDTLWVEGCFHWAGATPPLPHHLELEVGTGLKIRQHSREGAVYRWRLEAVQKGEQPLTLKLLEQTPGDHPEAPPPQVNHSLSALVTLRPSVAEQIEDLYADHVAPLDAQIAARLRRLDPRLAADAVIQQPFQILEPERYLELVYADDPLTRARLHNLLDAARREQWYNADLINTLLQHFVPTYLPGVGAVTACDPILASRLIDLHPDCRIAIEYSLLFAEDNDDSQIRQRIAAYLLHEKYGHGFFYTQTGLGRQIALLRQRREELPGGYHYVLDLLHDSSIICNEGFATWLELTVLQELDREVRQAFRPRYKLMVEENRDFKHGPQGDFFRIFPPRYDSWYREGWEYQDFIARTFGRRCAVQLLLLSCEMDLGVRLEQGRLSFVHSAEDMQNRLLNTRTAATWCSHIRLRRIAEHLYNQDPPQIPECSPDCAQTGCQLANGMDFD